MAGISFRKGSFEDYKSEFYDPTTGTWKGVGTDGGPEDGCLYFLEDNSGDDGNAVKRNRIFLNGQEYSVQDAKGVVTEEDIIVTTATGNYGVNTHISAGTSVEEILKRLLAQDKDPVANKKPTVSISACGFANNQAITPGDTVALSASVVVTDAYYEYSGTTKYVEANCDISEVEFVVKNNGTQVAISTITDTSKLAYASGSGNSHKTGTITAEFDVTSFSVEEGDDLTLTVTVTYGAGDNANTFLGEATTTAFAAGTCSATRSTATAPSTYYYYGYKTSAYDYASVDATAVQALATAGTEKTSVSPLSVTLDAGTRSFYVLVPTGAYSSVSVTTAAGGTSFGSSVLYGSSDDNYSPFTVARSNGYSLKSKYDLLYISAPTGWPNTEAFNVTFS